MPGKSRFNMWVLRNVLAVIQVDKPKVLDIPVACKGYQSQENAYQQIFFCAVSLEKHWGSQRLPGFLGTGINSVSNKVS